MRSVDDLCQLIRSRVSWTDGETPVEITPETPLLETGLLDSLTIRRIVADLDRTAGIALPRSQVKAANFRTPAALWQAVTEARAAATGPRA